MKKGFLLCDGEKNCVLISQEDLYKTLDQIIEQKIKEDEVKTHKTRSDLNKTISDYLKGIYRVKPEDFEGGEVNACS
jgi:hypothetical protein